MLNNQFVTRLTILGAVILVTGMALMGFLLEYAQGTLVMILSIVGMLLLLLSLGIGLGKWAIRPVMEIQHAARQLCENWGPDVLGPKNNQDDELLDLGRTLAQLASRSRERIQALESEQAKVAAILNSMVEGVVALDNQGRVLLMNPSARRIFDVGKKPVEGQFLLEVIRNRGLADLVERCRTLQNSERCRGEVEFKLPVNRVLEANAMQLPFSPMSRGTLLVLHDITELRRLEQVRAEFVANVSHELRTPLTAIKGYLETLLDEASPQSTTHRRFLEVANTHAKRLGRLVNDLLSLSDIETGKVILHLESVCLHGLIEEVSAIFENEASKKGVTLINEVGKGYCVYADRDRLSQILLNLVENAVKYTPQGGQVTFRASPRSENRIGLQVQDTGQGIPPSDLPRITERFYRVDKTRSREAGGTGLGLAIVKHLVQLHGGTLQIESEVGKGTMIEVALPASQLIPVS